MKPDYVNPFIQSVIETFDSMLDCEVGHGEPTPTTDNEEAICLIGVTGLSGTAQGNIAIKFPIDTATAVIGSLVNTKYGEINSSVVDGVGELINIIAGNAKAKIRGHKISISLPTVFKGCLQKLSAPAVSNITIPFYSNLGNFEILLSFGPTVQITEEALHESANSR